MVTSLAITTPLTFSKTWRAQNSNFCVQHTPSYLPASLCTCQLHALHVSASFTHCTYQLHCFTHCTYQLHALHLSASRTARISFTHPRTLKRELLKIAKRNLKSFLQFHRSILCGVCSSQSPKCPHSVWVQIPAQDFLSRQACSQSWAGHV